MQKNTQRTGNNPSIVTPPAKQGFTRRIGSTTYKVAVHFSKTSTESMSDKIVRLIKSEAENGKAARK